MERAQTRNLFLGLRIDHKYGWILTEESWNALPQKVIVLYVKKEVLRSNPEYHETRETLWEAGRTTSQG